MTKNDKYKRVSHLIRLLDEPANDNDGASYIRALRKLGKTGKPSAAPVIAGFLHLDGPVGRRAALSLVRLGNSSSLCFAVVLRIVQERLETSVDPDEIRNALHVYETLEGPYTRRDAA